jgi:hypothetical protein
MQASPDDRPSVQVRRVSACGPVQVLAGRLPALVFFPGRVRDASESAAMRVDRSTGSVGADVRQTGWMNIGRSMKAKLYTI